MSIIAHAGIMPSIEKPKISLPILSPIVLLIIPIINNGENPNRVIKVVKNHAKIILPLVALLSEKFIQKRFPYKALLNSEGFAFSIFFIFPYKAFSTIHTRATASTNQTITRVTISDLV